MPLTDNHPMPYGKYAGKRMGDVPAVYLLWLFDNGKCTPEVKSYVLVNMDGLKQEASKTKRY